jgi:hypothetical protein
MLLELRKCAKIFPAIHIACDTINRLRRCRLHSDVNFTLESATLFSIPLADERGQTLHFQF